jgi:hypothetical protein
VPVSQSDNTALEHFNKSGGPDQVGDDQNSYPSSSQNTQVAANLQSLKAVEAFATTANVKLTKKQLHQSGMGISPPPQFQQNTLLIDKITKLTTKEMEEQMEEEYIESSLIIRPQKLKITFPIRKFQASSLLKMYEKVKTGNFLSIPFKDRNLEIEQEKRTSSKDQSDCSDNLSDFSADNDVNYEPEHETNETSETSETSDEEIIGKNYYFFN